MLALVVTSACLGYTPSTPSQTSHSPISKTSETSYSPTPSSSEPSHSSTPSPSETSPSTSPPKTPTDTNPPKIIEFNWSPTKVVWDKIYDIKVSFKVVDDKTPIKYAELHFIPVEYEYFITKYGMRPEDYPKVFPPEKERVYELTPLDGEFDETEEEFRVSITNITGGREYKIIIIAEDEVGNIQKFEYKTPYIRQYENFGRQLYENGIIVGASYMPWDFMSTPMKDGYTPVLGRYDTLDDIVQWKHIDWAGYAGINVFFY